ncbi:MAG: hypothetical protein IKI20_07385 [Lachnospiraceae bacterium]|nr:hypothetical protein [Lachnospiraceae bacterium]
MNGDFHYYATYCAAFLAGYTHEESLDICYCAQLVDLCSRTFLSKVHGPMGAATTQLGAEMINAKTDSATGRQDITQIWASFHFLPGDLYAEKKRCTKTYRSKYRLICNSNSDLMVDTVNLAKGKPLQAVGVSMHVLADTWAHKYFAGTPSLVINNTNYYFYELFGDEEKQITFRHSASTPDDLENSIYTSSIYQNNENSVMNLGHGRAGHLPDYSFIRYKYLPAWKGYEEIIKDNPSDFIHAFAQMVCAMKYLRGDMTEYGKESYDWDGIAAYRERIETIINTRQLDASEDWKALGEELSGRTVEEFNLSKYEEEYTNATEEEKKKTFLGRFFVAAMAQKSMVTNRIHSSKNILAGYSFDYKKNGFKGNKDFKALITEETKEGEKNE